jgi:signal transduction histidine kinase/ligand-binding sensor domain-containing protein
MVNNMARVRYFAITQAGVSLNILIMREVIKRRLIFLILVWKAALCQSQDVKFSHLTPDQGLLSGNTLCTVQDYQGFFWFGSEEGLQRYDGYSFKNYFADKIDSTSLSSSFVRQMLEDTHHNLWIGTFDGGLCWYDRENDRFIRFQHDPGDEHSIIGNFIQMMFEGADGTMYVGAVGHGISAFKIPEKVTNKIQFVNYRFPETREYSTTRWAGVMAETNMGLLLAINGVGINRLDPKSRTFTPILKDSVGSRTQCLLFDSRQRLWIGTWDEGLYVVDRGKGNMTHHIARSSSGYLSHNQVYTLTEDDGGNIWIGTDNGLNLLPHDVDPFSPAPFTTFKHDPHDAYSLLSNSIKDIYIDKRHRMWLATYFGGVNIYDKSLLQFRSFKSNGPGAPGLSHSNVFTLEEDKAGNVWVGTDGGGLNFAQGPVDQIQKEDFVKIKLSRNSQLVEKIKCLKVDDKGNLWVGTWGDGLFKVNTKDHSSQHFPLAAFRGAKLPVNEVLAVDIDSVGNLWIGTFGFGVLYYDLATRSVRQFLQAESGSDEREVNKVNDVHVDKQGRVWVARDGGGLSLIEPRENRYRVMETGLLTNTLTVTSIMEDSSGLLWLGTNSAGVIIYDPMKKTTRSYDDTSGLTTNSVVATAEDKNNDNIWIGTNKGLTSIERATNKINHFTKSDGLPGNQFNNNAVLRDKQSGMLLFGGIEGLTAFHADHIQVNTFNPPIVFTHFKVDNQDVTIGPDSPLKKNITLTEQIDLKHFQNSFSLEFAALQYDPAQRNQYAYWLENFNDKWIGLGSERKTTFTALAPGTYIFRVRATNNDGDIMSKQAVLRIVIHPAWWQTILFKVLVTAALVVLAFTIFQTRLANLKRQRVALKKQVAEAIAEIEKKNIELEAKVVQISVRDNEIQSQNEELIAQNEQILHHRQSLEEAHDKLKVMNNHLEELVQQRTAKLESTVQELDTVVSELDRFVYSASHDLSAPLKSVLGLVNILRDDPEKLQTYCDYIERSISKLDNVIRSLVEFSRNSHYPVAHVDVNVHDIVAEVVEELAFWPEAHRVKVNNEVTPNLVVKSDPERLKVILHNLIGNGIKYVDATKPSPSIWIESFFEGTTLVLQVKDNGIGIEESNHARIFDMFFRGSDRSKGSGLGLFIVKETVNKLKGAISLKSEYSVGTTFEIRLPG